MNKPEGKYLTKSKEYHLEKLSQDCDKHEEINYQKDIGRTGRDRKAQIVC